MIQMYNSKRILLSLDCHVIQMYNSLRFQLYLCGMTEQDLKELLARPELNKSGIAEKMFEGKSNPRGRLHNKINNVTSGHSTQRLTEDDLKKGWEVLKDLADDIYSREPEK